MKRKRGRKPQTPKTNGHAPEEQLLQCDDCEFSSPDLNEITEHLSGTGHTGYEAKTVDKKEPGLFSEPAPILRSLPVPLSPEEIAKLNAELASIATQTVDQSIGATRTRSWIRVRCRQRIGQKRNSALLRSIRNNRIRWRRGPNAATDGTL